MIDNKKIGRFIYNVRKEKQMTQTDLADKLNISHQAVSKWESGLALPDTGLLLPLADILNITVDELLRGTKSTEINPPASHTIDAKDIIREINQGADLHIKNMTITGDLSFIHAQQHIEAEESNFIFKRLIKFITKHFAERQEIRHLVQGNINFTNCHFYGKIIAAYQSHNVTYKADFQKKLVFQKCTFEKDVLFKHSQFSGDTHFEKSVFKERADFKFARFLKEANFKSVSFQDITDFKYTKLIGRTTFEQSKFEADVTFKYLNSEHNNFKKSTFKGFADFKYAHFLKEISFDESVFHFYADFKYANLSEASVKNAQFHGSSDFKYTKYTKGD